MTEVTEPRPEPAPGGPAGLVVARRPLVDPDGRVVAFQLVLRPSGPAGDLPDAPTVSLADLLGSAGTSQEDLVGEALAMCAVGRAELVGERPLSLRPDVTILEVDPTLLADPAVVAACRARRAEGFRVLSDVQVPDAEVPDAEVPDAEVPDAEVPDAEVPDAEVPDAEVPDAEEAPALPDGLLEAADLVRVQVGGVDRTALLTVVEACRAAGAGLVAAGCVGADDLDWARSAGFELMGGDAVGSADLPAGGTIAPSVLSQVQLGVELLSAELSLDRIEMILRGEPGLVVQVLGLASLGADGGARRRVRSLREALVVLGSVRLRQWAAITILGRHGEVRADALVTGLVRARMCELLAHQRGIDRSIAFTAGLLSSLDGILGVELHEVERRVAVDDALAAAAFRGESPLGVLVGNVREYQHAVDVGFPPPPRLGDLGLVSAMSFCWATSYVHQMRNATGG